MKVKKAKNIKSLDVVLAELNEFVGMDSVKAEIIPYVKDGDESKGDLLQP